MRYLIYIVLFIVLLPVLAYPMGGISCTDGILNQDETSIDCGGVCIASQCSNGNNDCDETGVDCGGAICAACPVSCFDGIQNQTETGVDCGGPCSDCGGPEFLWAKSTGGPENDYSHGLAIDASGNVYTTGYFRGTADFDPGPGTYNLTSAGGNDIFVSKLDAAGNFVWAKRMGGSASDWGNSIVIDGSGNVYTTGTFGATADFDPGSGSSNLSPTGSWDLFISKLDAAGNFVWAKKIGDAGWDIGYSITVDGSGNVYTTGVYVGTTDFDPGGGTYNITSAGGDDMFISKLDAAGNFVWAKSIGGTSAEAGYSVTVQGGFVYTTGIFNGTADFDPSGATFNLVGAGGYDAFVSKLDVAGNFVWAKSIGGTNLDYGTSIAVDGSDNIYTTGYFKATVDFDPGASTYNLTSVGSWDIFMSKLDAAGNFVWAKRMGGTLNDWEGVSIVLDASFLYITCDQYSSIVDYDPGPGVHNLVNLGSEAIVIGKYDYDGNYVCAFILSPGHNEFQRNRHLAVDGTGNVYVSGSFNDPSADFDPCPPVYNAPGYGNLDHFVAKYDMSECNCGVPLTVTINSFSGKNMGEFNLLEWTTVSEINNDYFIIERSPDGNAFYDIGQVEGAGNSNIINNYQYTDEHIILSEKELYYRLKQVDFDGQYTYSKTISIEVNVKSTNPVIQQTSDYLVISMDEQEAAIYIYDIMGRIVHHEQVKGLQEHKIPLNELKSGIYYLNIRAGSQNYQQKLVIY